ncbi:MAG: hypothetical protein KIT16_23200, partial [Rhodospirillaceae bacterium]|nr:hypothetical protein [Rhodospirillaceae bacterium]
EALMTLEVPAASLVRGAPGSLGRLAVTALTGRRHGAVAPLLAQRGIKTVAAEELGAAAAGASVVAHRGDAAIAEAALLAGRPQIVLPSTLDQRVVARLLDALQVALIVTGEKPETRIGDAFARLATDQTWRDRALFHAKRLADSRPPDGSCADPLGEILAACAHLA